MPNMQEISKVHQNNPCSSVYHVEPNKVEYLMTTPVNHTLA